jgi:hypothetical protein
MVTSLGRLQRNGAIGSIHSLSSLVILRHQLTRKSFGTHNLHELYSVSRALTLKDCNFSTHYIYVSYDSRNK